MNSSKFLENAYYQEWAFVYGRKFLLNILALGSLLVTHKIGVYIGNLLFPNSPSLVLFIQVIFMALGYAGIDWVLANALASASNVEADEEKVSKKPVWIFAIAALLSTLLLSLSSNFFISQEMAGKTHLNEFNDQIKQATVQDSVMKIQAFNSLGNATEEQKTLVKAAKKEKNRLINEAVKKGSPSWQNDYRKHKNKPKGWFWVCTDCPPEYIDYRKSILTAREEGTRLIYEANNHKKFIQDALSPTLSYQLSTDSILIAFKENTLKMEAERLSRKTQLNIILLIMTLGCAILSLILTYVLKDHRKKYGQQVIENNVRSIMIIFDIIGRLGNSFADLIYTLFVQPFNFLKSKNIIKTYQLSSTDNSINRLTNSPTINITNGSVNGSKIAVKRLCDKCLTDIEHKRSDARFCSDKCRMEYHNFVPHKSRKAVN